MLPKKQKQTLWRSQFLIDGPSLTCCYTAIFDLMMMKLGFQEVAL